MAVTYKDLLTGLELTMNGQYRNDVDRAETVLECVAETLRLMLEKLRDEHDPK